MQGAGRDDQIEITISVDVSRSDGQPATLGAINLKAGGRPAASEADLDRILTVARTGPDEFRAGQIRPTVSIEIPDRPIYAPARR